MIIMALDHTRDFMHAPALTQDPTDLTTTTPWLFFTRWITHLCAPTFVFLSGTSVFLSVKSQQNRAEARRFLLTRGLWLVFLEFTIVNFALWFDIRFHVLFSQVIAAIGMGFVLLSLLLWLSPKSISILGAILLVSHQAIQFLLSNGSPVVQGINAVFFARGAFPISPDHLFVMGYPIVPWFSLMLLGYGLGTIFELSEPVRFKKLIQLGLGSLVLFVILRSINGYGDPSPWKPQKEVLFSVLSFLNVTKYPPSLMYSLLMLGIALLILATSENFSSRLSRVISIYGKVPMFYYLIHWYVLHSLMIVLVLGQGFSWDDIQFNGFNLGRPPQFGFPLGWVYVIWGSVVASLFPLCRWYAQYKASHREKTWLRYL